jgi:hypothetical protein
LHSPRSVHLPFFGDGLLEPAATVGRFGVVAFPLADGAVGACGGGPTVAAMAVGGIE